ncbi:MAG: hypothetical protein R3F46_15890 [bacterium]
MVELGTRILPGDGHCQFHDLGHAELAADAREQFIADILVGVSDRLGIFQRQLLAMRVDDVATPVVKLRELFVT